MCQDVQNRPHRWAWLLLSSHIIRVIFTLYFSDFQHTLLSQSSADSQNSICFFTFAHGLVTKRVIATDLIVCCCHWRNGQTGLTCSVCVRLPLFQWWNTLPRSNRRPSPDCLGTAWRTPNVRWRLWGQLHLKETQEGNKNGEGGRKRLIKIKHVKSNESNTNNPSISIMSIPVIKLHLSDFSILWDEWC